MKYIFYFIIVIVIYRLIHFLTTPFLKKLKIYKYYSPLFLIVPYMPAKYEIHLGTSWDFFKLPSINTKVYINYLAEGLLKLIEDVEKCKIKSNAVFKGNTYYFKPKTLERFGFTFRKLKPIEFILFLLSYIETTILHSISNKKLTIIHLNNLYISTISAKELLYKKQELLEFTLLEKSKRKEYMFHS
ncbi:MAG TPA: hypothetical protein PLC04_00325 [Candidatus Kapabacteria bacterium]|nr:hypothetical protein [Candidatus Kapabacteria bacterium]HOV91517.1 hypothetical protein [Candidatus Kapabacteria bacterium]